MTLIILDDMTTNIITEYRDVIVTHYKLKKLGYNFYAYHKATKFIIFNFSDNLSVYYTDDKTHNNLRKSQSLRTAIRIFIDAGKIYGKKQKKHKDLTLSYLHSVLDGYPVRTLEYADHHLFEKIDALLKTPK